MDRAGLRDDGVHLCVGLMKEQSPAESEHLSMSERPIHVIERLRVGDTDVCSQKRLKNVRRFCSVCTAGDHIIIIIILLLFPHV